MKGAIGSFLILVCLAWAAAQQRPSELSGYVTYPNKSPAKAVVVSVGSFSVATDANGYYRITALKAGARRVSLSPPGKKTRSFPVTVGTQPTKKDFVVFW